MSDIGARLKTMLDEGKAARELFGDAGKLRDEVERLRKWIELVQQQNSDLRERVTMLVEAAAEDAQRVRRLEAIIAKKESTL